VITCREYMDRRIGVIWQHRSNVAAGMTGGVGFCSMSKTPLSGRTSTPRPFCIHPLRPPRQSVAQPLLENHWKSHRQRKGRNPRQTGPSGAWTHIKGARYPPDELAAFGPQRRAGEVAG